MTLDSCNDSPRWPWRSSGETSTTGGKASAASCLEVSIRASEMTGFRFHRARRGLARPQLVFPPQDREPIWQGAACVGDGPRRADRGGSGRDARGRSACAYLVGTPKGRLTRLEKQLVDKPWRKAREGVEVKLLAQDDELYVLARSADRVSKERAMRRRQLKWLWARLKKLAEMDISREERLMKLGAARSKAPCAWRLVKTDVDKTGALAYALDRDKLRKVRRREGRYLLRTNLTGDDPATLWQYYI